MAAAQTEHEIPRSMLSIQFLHANSTTHTGPFSAIAELIDNAYDPDVNAKQIWIDKTKIIDTECLTFRDDGNGLSYVLMYEMLSYGFSNKKALNGKHPIGMYGSGFQNGSMHLGKDVIILSKSKDDLCVGMLSQTYLDQTGGNVIIVPIISCNKQEANKFSLMEENRASLRDILEHSPFNTEEELLTELRAIEGPTGTKIIIWNLHRTSEGHMKLDFNTENDIRISCDDSDTSVPERNSSLRAYCSILYLEPSMQINIRGHKVENRPIYKSLEYIDRSYSYKPKAVKEKIPIIFGHNKSKEDYGLMMYYHNRLIKAYHRVGCQLKAKNRISIGVIGVFECNYLTPTPNKEGFVYEDTYRNTLQSLGSKLKEYSGKRRNNPADNVPIGETDDMRTHGNNQLQETSGEGPSGAKRPRPNCDEGESEMHMSLRSSAAPTHENVEIRREQDRLLEANRSLTQENQDLKTQIENLNSKVAQLEEEKASLSEECEQKKARLEDVVRNGLDAVLRQMQSQ